MPSTYTPIATTTLGSAANTVTFSSISGFYTDLILVMSGSLAITAYVTFRVGNGSLDTNSNYSTTLLNGNGSAAASGRYTNQTSGRCTYYGSGTNIFNCILHFQNYSNTTTYKTILGRFNSSTTSVDASASLWRSTSAINTISVLNDDNINFLAGSTFTLYGVKNA